jgi:ATP-dependent DNA ligase
MDHSAQQKEKFKSLLLQAYKKGNEKSANLEEVMAGLKLQLADLLDDKTRKTIIRKKA